MKRATPDLRQFRNQDGTYNGVAFLANMTGLSYAEVEWTARRIKELLLSGMDRKEAVALVKQEAKEGKWKP